MFKKNITFKLTLGFLTIVIVSTLFIGIIALKMFKNNIYQIKKNNIKKHALAISKTIEPYITDTSNNKDLILIYIITKKNPLLRSVKIKYWISP